MDNVIPCGNCKRMYPCCHDECEEYKNWRKNKKYPLNPNFSKHRRFSNEYRKEHNINGR